MKAHRPARVAEVIREVASETILFKLNDPRVKNVTVTRAEVSADLQRAKVYVSVMGTEQEQQMCLHGLANAAGYVQKQLGDRLKMRFTPVLQFVPDAGVKNSIAISRLLKDEEAKAPPPTPAEGETAPTGTDEESANP
jgi:ribosome-binding factor A